MIKKALQPSGEYELLVKPISDLIPNNEDIVVSPEDDYSEPEDIEVSDESHLSPDDQDIIVVLDSDLPGAPPGTSHPVIEVSEDDAKEKTKKEKEHSIWDWDSHGHHGFIQWIKERGANVPRHSGYDSAGLARAHAYLEKLDDEISRAMKTDFEGVIDAKHIEAIRKQIQKGISALEERMEHVSSKKVKKASFTSDFVKNAQSASGVKGVYVTVPLLISRIARTCINGHVSAGHSLKDLYAQQVKAYSLTKREQAEVKQLIADMGLPMWDDRGLVPDSDIDISDDGLDLGPMYKS
jgi:hypothetical protein